MKKGQEKNGIKSRLNLLHMCRIEAVFLDTQCTMAVRNNLHALDTLVHVDGALDGVCILGGASCLLFSTLGPEGGKMEKRDRVKV